MNQLTSLDLAIFHSLNSLAGHSGVSDFLIVALAEYLFYAVMMWFAYTIICAWSSDKKIFYGYCIALVSAVFSRLVVTGVIRHFYHHPRPFVTLHFIPLFSETSYSFPSGHAIFLFGLSMGVYFVNKKQGFYLFGISAVICIARVIAGVHYPSDILGGLVLGSALSYVIFRYLYPSQR